MKILMILDEEYPHDVRVKRELTILKSNNEITLLCVNYGKQKSNEIIDGVQIIRFNISKKIYKKIQALAYTWPLYYYFWKYNINKHLKDERFDCIHAHDLPIVKVAYKYSSKTKIPLILDFHENRPEIMKFYDWTNTFLGKLLISLKKWENVQKKYSQLADKLILVTNEARDYYINKYNLLKEKVLVVPNYANVNEIENIPEDNELIEKYRHKLTIIYFGDTGLRRGTMDIVEVANMLKNNIDIHFIIAGYSKEQYILENKVKEFGLKNVEFTGYISEYRAIQYMKACKIGISPLTRNIHHDTTFANKIFQYMSCKLPIIVSDCPSQANIVKENNCGFIYSQGDIDKLYTIISNMTEDEIIEKENNAFTVVKEKYSIEKIDMY